MSILKTLIKQGSLCFDIGAHTGEKAKEMLVLGASKIITVEPQASLLKLQSTDKIVVLEKAVSNKQGKIKFSICDQAYTVSTVTEHWKYGRFANLTWNKSLEVEATTLDDLIKEYGLPHFCKIDVEGHEVAVLQGLSHTIPCLSFEFTAEFIEHAYECIDLLLSIGNYEFNLTSNQQNPEQFDLTDWLSGYDLYKHLLRASIDKEIWGDVYAKSR
jgi:FkbM family methyltransferase